MMHSNLSLYWAFIKMEFIRNLTYRTSYVTGIFNYTIQIGAYFFLWKAVYGQASSLGGMSINTMLSYVIIAWVTRAFYFNNVDREISKEIREGKVALELIRPYSYAGVKIARAMGEAVFRMIFFSLPSAVLIFWLYPFQRPAGTISLIIFLVATMGSFLLNVQLSVITGYLAFFTHSTSGVLRARRVIVDLLSGLLIPINFFPLWAQKVINYLPFKNISYLPNMIYLGKVQGWQALQVVLAQVFWLCILIGIAHWIWRRAVKQLVVQGG